MVTLWDIGKAFCLVCFNNFGTPLHSYVKKNIYFGHGLKNGFIFCFLTNIKYFLLYKNFQDIQTGYLCYELPLSMHSISSLKDFLQ